MILCFSINTEQTLLLRGHRHIFKENQIYKKGLQSGTNSDLYNRWMRRYREREVKNNSKPDFCLVKLAHGGRHDL